MAVSHKNTEGDKLKHGGYKKFKRWEKESEENSNDTVMECEMGSNDFPIYLLLWT
jgi:hypothetical protein